MTREEFERALYDLVVEANQRKHVYRKYGPVDQLVAEYDRLTAVLATVTAERDAARAEVEQLREALNAANEDAQDLYDMANDDSQHDWRCSHYHLDKGLPCNCGLEKVLKNHEARLASTAPNEEEK